MLEIWNNGLCRDDRWKISCTLDHVRRTLYTWATKPGLLALRAWQMSWLSSYGNVRKDISTRMNLRGVISFSLLEIGLLKTATFSRSVAQFFSPRCMRSRWQSQMLVGKIALYSIYILKFEMGASSSLYVCATWHSSWWDFKAS